LIITVLACYIGLSARCLFAAGDPLAGLAQTLRSGALADHRSVDGIAMFVPAGEPPTPFLPAGPFTASWSGSLSVDLRGDYSFHAVFTGHLKLSINDAVVLDSDGKSPAWIESPKVRLNKGANRILAEYAAPKTGEAEVRVHWSSKEVPINPIPTAALAHAITPEITEADRLRRGRHLFAELRCIRCHPGQGTLPELSADAPAFAGIGSRRRAGWLAQWVANPESLRPGGPMPKVFHGSEARAQSEAVAAFLTSLKAPSPASQASAPSAETVETGKALYEKLLCVACHVAPESETQAVQGKISLKMVRSKFAQGALMAFLMKPSEHFVWTRMPDFRLSNDEAFQLAAHLESVADQPPAQEPSSDDGLVTRGRKLVQESGCLNCHALDLPNAFKARSLAELKPGSWTSGCLAESPAADSTAPRFALAASDRLALAAFGRSDRSSLTRHTAADFLERQSEALHCRECHGRYEGFPTWELLGGKLKPEWTTRFIGGSESWKPRPWLESRMPAFPAHAAALAQGLNTAHGLAPISGPDDPADVDLAKVGHKLVGSSGGFACVSCHSVGDFGATQVFEAPGINLAHSYERLQPDFFRRWLRNPVSMDPNSKMPAYFDEDGRSALSEVLDGDGPKTIRALWEYLRLGSKMPKPE